MTLRTRVTVAATVVLTLGLGIIGVALNLVLANRLSADASALLRERSATELAAFERGGRPGEAGLERQVWRFDPSGRMLTRPLADEHTQALAQALSGTNGPREVSIDEQVRLLATPAFDARDRRIGTVVVGVSLEPYERTEHLVAIGTAALALLVIAGGALVARRAVDAALRPVAQMTRQAARWSDQDLDQRFDLGPARDELTALAATLDGLLGRLGAALRHEHRFSAEVAHELRTPLSGLRAEAEHALRRPHSEQELRAALTRVIAGTDRMDSVIETLLRAARREAAGSPGVSDAAATVRAVAGPDVRVVAPAGPVPVGADEELVIAALRPLLENAERHAARGVRAEIHRAGTVVTLVIADDGPGVAPTDVAQLFAPGFSRTGGAGLGLSLARRLARAAGGDVVLGPTGFELQLPSASLP